jgi:tripartite-type tricarboxylate transporter receptor subunit TctC
MKWLQSAALAVAACLAISATGWAQADRSLRLIVPYPAGGGGDILARLLADSIERTQGLNVVVENRPGAGTAVGTEAVSRAAPDGTAVLMNAPEFVINPHLRPLNYDPIEGFEPVCYLVNIPAVLVVNGQSPYRTLADFIAAARGKPGELTLASTGPGTVFHVAVERLKQVAGVNFIFVPYPGNAPATNALLGGHVNSGFAVYPVVASQIESGTLRALAVASPTRITELPDVPTFAEMGYPDYIVDVWLGIVAPAKTPREATNRLAQWFSLALQDREIQPKLAAQGFHAAPSCGAPFAAYLRQQHQDYGRIIRDANIKPQ